jgi:hypothetical protein
LEKIDVQKKIDDAIDLNKILKPYVGISNKEIKRTAKKQSFKQVHVQNKKHQKKNAKHMQNRKYRKNKLKKNKTAGQVGQLLASTVIFFKNTAAAQLLGQQLNTVIN